MILALANVLGTLLYNCYVACFWVGWAITTSAVKSFKLLAMAFRQTFLAARILAEDFTCFLEDVGEIVEKLAWLAYDLSTAGVDRAVDVASSVLLFIKSTPANVCEAVASVKIVSALVRLVVFVRDVFLLVGLCVWETVEFIFELANFLFLIWPGLVVAFLTRKADQFADQIVRTAQDQWFKSACGLVVCYVLYRAVSFSGILNERKLKPVLRRFLSRVHASAAVVVCFVVTGGRVVARKTALAAESFRACAASCWRTAVREFTCRTPTIAALQMKLEQEQAANLCVVCMAKRREVMLLNCRHMLMCKVCAIIVAHENGVCPVCRKPIDNIVNVYT
ncbi:RING finger [Nesidiocoris tenuis]|uniref:RING finger n=1 Tax=Nesidiocoris tenuis TaxID=355587 RepID=A0ABN7B6A9_9HEMI|nr:RING finger [Nesidiocoris tenuis]